MAQHWQSSESVLRLFSRQLENTFQEREWA